MQIATEAVTENNFYMEATDCITELEKKYQKLLIVNTDLDRTLVSFQANKSEPIYRWFHYREGFSKQLIEYILDKLGAKNGERLLDPFAGTGAAPFVAENYKNMQGIAIELMPVGAFFIKCRNVFAGLTAKQIIKFAKDALEKREEWLQIEPTWIFRHLTITAGAFPGESEIELCKYKTWIEQQSETKYKLFLDFVAFSILERFSFTRKDGQYLRWDCRAPRFENKEVRTSFDKGEILSFYEALREKLEHIIKDLSCAGNLFETPQGISANTVEVIQGSVLKEIDQIKPDTIDYIVTSPPYCNRYDYTRTYALELAYLGVTEEEIRKLRQTLLTCTVENKPKQFEWLDAKFKEKIDKVFSKQKCLKSIIDFLANEAKQGKLNNKGIKTLVEGYFYDTTVHLAQTAPKIKKGGHYVMVNDNVRYNGLEVPVDLLLSEIAAEFGLQTEKIWVLPKGKGNSSQQMKKHGRMELRKCVYIWKKL